MKKTGGDSVRVYRSRKYPIQYEKTQGVENEPRSIDLSMAAAAGIVTAAFIAGVVSGWMLRRRR